MSGPFSGLYPEKVWKIFQDICKIPHPSKKEMRIMRYVANAGKDAGLETIVDETGNVLIRKPAASEYKRRKGVILQSHMDMVPQKNNNVAHDFEKDPIQVYKDGEWGKARGTTLGADNGIGVAAALAVLLSRDIEHGPLEALFTVDEETGMTGAFQLPADLLQGDILINLDSEKEDELIIGCAGGINTIITMPFTKEPVPRGSQAFQISISGLRGGHSGVDIHLGRGNANKILNRFLWQAARSFFLHLSHIQGGGMRNAIPREASALVMVPEKFQKDFLAFVHKSSALIRSELALTDPDVTICAKPAENLDFFINSEAQANLLNALYSCPDGVIGMSSTMPGIVETSTNLATIRMSDDHCLIETMQRSAVQTQQDDICNRIRSVFELAGGVVEHIDPYPGWQPNPNSPVLKVMESVYKEMHGRLPEIKIIHAGLESGLIGDLYPHLDLISCGPTIRFPHSPDEKVHIPSVGRFWDFLLETLKQIPEK